MNTKNAYSFRTELSTRASGMFTQEREMDEEFKCGQMAHDMRGIGKVIRLMDEEG